GHSRFSRCGYHYAASRYGGQASEVGPEGFQCLQIVEHHKIIVCSFQQGLGRDMQSFKNHGERRRVHRMRRVRREIQGEGVLRKSRISAFSRYLEVAGPLRMKS